ncbi:2-hydroxychromene-2-carboxylate isomerase [Sandaracinobacter sp.]|uniref:2-hydroxychromene-2-carboxylate isomerase n=1 Tax=Sandaracinobacter sp. TaxID=2487581 RepID=UPI0035B20360
MTQQVEIFYDFRSPYSYLAFTQLVKMDVELILRPMQILKVMERVGNVPTTITCAAKGRYAGRDLGRWAGRYGIALNPADMRAVDGDATGRAVLAAATPTEALAVTMALYRACWSEQTTLPTSDDVVAALAAAGIDTSGIAARIDLPETQVALEANSDEAVARDVFGTPSMFVGDTLFFGNDRLDFLAEELARKAAA